MWIHQFNLKLSNDSLRKTIVFTSLLYKKNKAIKLL